MFAYTKNNPINMKDDHGFLSSSVFGEGGEGTYTSQNLAKSVGNSGKEVGKGATISASEESLNKVTIYSSTTKIATRKSTKVISEVTLSAKHLGKALKIAGGISAGISIADNFSGRYSTNAALVRSLFDVGGFVAGVIAGAALVGSGGIVIVGIGIAVATETFKLGATYFIDKKF